MEPAREGQPATRAKKKKKKPQRGVDSRVTPQTYRRHRLYPGIVKAVDTLLARGDVVAPVDVLVETGRLDADRLLDWRRGRTPYLEKVLRGNLGRLGRFLRILSMHAHDLGLKPSQTIYRRWGKGCKQQLRFTKTREPNLERAYARHFVRPGGDPTHPVQRNKSKSPPAQEGKDPGSQRSQPQEGAT
ncbi:MAG: hypothetical protein RL885_16235 [Planctomycetota bacterium]